MHIKVWVLASCVLLCSCLNKSKKNVLYNKDKYMCTFQLGIPFSKGLSEYYERPDYGKPGVEMGSLKIGRLQGIEYYGDIMEFKAYGRFVDEQEVGKEYKEYNIPVIGPFVTNCTISFNGSMSYPTLQSYQIEFDELPMYVKTEEYLSNLYGKPIRTIDMLGSNTTSILKSPMPKLEKVASRTFWETGNMTIEFFSTVMGKEVEYFDKGEVANSKPYILYKLKDADRISDSILKSKIENISLADFTTVIELNYATIEHRGFYLTTKESYYPDSLSPRSVNAFFGRISFESNDGESVTMPNQKIVISGGISSRGSSEAGLNIITVNNVDDLSLPLRKFFEHELDFIKDVKFYVDSIKLSDGTILR